MKKQLGLLAFLILIMVSVAACGGVEHDEAQAPIAPEGGMYAEDMLVEAPMAEMEAAEPAVSGASSISMDRLIIRNGSINMQVDDTYQARHEIEVIVEQLVDNGAFVLSASENGGTEYTAPQINMVIRVPADAFDNVMEQIAGLAVVVDSREEYSQDVTEEYSDIENRLESLEAARLRLLEIMENADTTEDLLQAERQLTQRETEIESLKGRQKYLSESARLSRITIVLQPYILSQPIDTGWKPLETIRKAIDDLIDGIKGFIDFLIYFTIAVAPWLVLFGYIAYLVIRYFRKRKLKSAQPEE